MVRIRLLGRFSVLRNSAEIPLRAFGGLLPQQLLRLLALRRGALIPKDVIAEALWPRRPPADARGNVEVLVSRIRRALGDPALIRTGPGGYSLTGGRECWVDVEAFLSAARDGRGLLADHPAEALAWFRG
ncbi:MAG: AfsR/SARP family transcriptional regulator, partial [Trebonia sp.]